MFSRSLIASCILMACGAASATTVYSNNFEGSTAEWTGPHTIVPALFNKYLANDSAAGNVSGASVATFNVGAGTAVTGASLSLQVGIIDSWDNGNIGFGPDAFKVEVDGGEVFSAVFDNYLNGGPTVAPGLTTLSYGSNLAGNAGFNDAYYGLTVNLGTLAAGTHTLKFFASGPGWQGGSDESFALDNVVVEGTVVSVPEPEAYALVLAGLLAVGVCSKARRASGSRA